MNLKISESYQRMLKGLMPVSRNEKFINSLISQGWSNHYQQGKTSFALQDNSNSNFLIIIGRNYFRYSVNGKLTGSRVIHDTLITRVIDGRTLSLNSTFNTLQAI